MGLRYGSGVAQTVEVCTTAMSMRLATRYSPGLERATRCIVPMHDVVRNPTALAVGRFKSPLLRLGGQYAVFCRKVDGKPTFAY